MSTLKVFFDSQCPLCAEEMRRLAVWDRQHRLQMIDIQQAGFDAGAYGATWAAMNSELHVQDDQHTLLIGIDAICAIYIAVGKGWMVWPLRQHWARPVLQRAYRWFAQHRNRISGWLGKPQCSDGVCAARQFKRF